MGRSDFHTEDLPENFRQKVYTQVFKMTVRQSQIILTEPECRTLDKRADFIQIFSLHYSDNVQLFEAVYHRARNKWNTSDICANQAIPAVTMYEINPHFKSRSQGLGPSTKVTWPLKPVFTPHPSPATNSLVRTLWGEAKAAKDTMIEQQIRSSPDIASFNSTLYVWEHWIGRQEQYWLFVYMADQNWTEKALWA